VSTVVMEMFLVRQFKKINLAVGNGLDILGPDRFRPGQPNSNTALLGAGYFLFGLGRVNRH